METTESPRKQAIDDGVLIDVTATAEAGLGVALTSADWAWVDGVVWDLTKLIAHIGGDDNGELVTTTMLRN